MSFIMNIRKRALIFKFPNNNHFFVPNIRKFVQMFLNMEIFPNNENRENSNLDYLIFILALYAERECAVRKNTSN